MACRISRSLRLLGIGGCALFAHHLDPAENMISISNFEDLPDLLGNRYSSSSDHFSKERYLIFVEFDGHLLGHRR